MDAVVSLLDEKHYKLVEDLWTDLERRFGMRGIYVTPFPHFSYQVAERYDVDRLAGALKRFAARTRPFTVRTGGLGLFTGSFPVLYVPVVRTPPLSEVQDQLWTEVSPTAAGISPYYAGEQWQPHITLAHGDLDPERLGAATRYLAERDFHWEVLIANVALIHDTGEEQLPKHRYEFGGV